MRYIGETIFVITLAILKEEKSSLLEELPEEVVLLQGSLLTYVLIL